MRICGMLLLQPPTNWFFGDGCCGRSVVMETRQWFCMAWVTTESA